MENLGIKHNLNLELLQEQVRGFYRQKKKFRIYHGSTNSTRTQRFVKEAMVDVSEFNHVLEVNEEKKYAIVEPNVPMDRLVDVALRYGLVPPVVMEFPGITAGGGVQGGAGESSSFKYGGFHHTCLEYEMVLGNGEVIVANQRKNADLFFGTACSYGSLGIITKIKLKLIKAKPYVRLKYKRVGSFEEVLEMLGNLVKTKVDFIDGIMLAKNVGVVMSGVWSEKNALRSSRLRRAIDEWFYLHVEKIVRKESVYEELIPVKDYLFRYDRGGFWVGKYAFERGRVPFNRLTRFLFNRLFRTRTLYRFLQGINISQKQIVQDFILPCESALEFMEFVDNKTGIYPLWLLPGELATREDKLSPGFIKTKMGVDVGVWGKPRNLKSKISNLKFLNRELEGKLTELGGRKVLYAHQYYTKVEFWKIYDKKWYDDLRRKYFAQDVFPDVYEKTVVRESYEVDFWRGFLSVLRSPFRLPIN